MSASSPVSYTHLDVYKRQGKLSFTIYGKETRPANRTSKYVSETLGVTDPGEPIVKVDASLAPGARVTEQSSHSCLLYTSRCV